MRRGLRSELDEMWSFVQAKAHPIALHQTVVQ
jgi:hypothetical protein